MRLLLLLAFFFFVQVLAKSDRPQFDARYQSLTQQIKCVQCHGSSIAESDTIIAQNMRDFVHNRLAAGDSDKQIIDFLTERYGEQINTRPKASGATLWLWILPPLALLTGLCFVFRGHKQ